MAKTTIIEKIKRAPAAVKAVCVAGLAAVGLAVMRRRQNSGNSFPDTTVIAPAHKPKPKKAPAAKPNVQVKRQWLAPSFPLRRGMQGEAVGALQVALNKLSAGIAADGKFGQQTEAALAKLGYVATVTDGQFRAIKERSEKQQPKTGETAYQRLQRMGYNASAEIEPAIALRNQIKATLTDERKVRQLLSGANKTVTNIQRAYKTLYSSDIKADLLGLSMGRIRFGDLLNKLSALSGLGATEGQMVSARVNTLVKDARGNTVAVKVGTRLGSYLGQSQGVARFSDTNGNTLQVPASDVI